MRLLGPLAVLGWIVYVFVYFIIPNLSFLR